MNAMNILSLFDGIRCAKVALDRAGIEVKNYYACEIDKHATAVSERNHPGIVRLGDV
jgi:site-specific DNA-cytosine methylase